MYYTNFVSSSEGYFHTVICNSREYRNTTVNHDLHYIEWNDPAKEHPQTLTTEYFENMTSSGAAFAQKFVSDDPVLNKIDKEHLSRYKNHVTPGAWCVGSSKWGNDPCSVIGDPNILKPGPGAKRLEGLVLRQLSPELFRANQCRVQEVSLRE
jgi:protein xylosyltransferase